MTRFQRGVLLSGLVAGLSLLALGSRADPGCLSGTCLFELDGDAIEDATVDGDDWGQAGAPCGGFDSCGLVAGPPGDTGVTGGGAITGGTVFIKDGVGGTDDVHAGGGSKDDLPLSSWKAKLGSVSDKTNISEAMAAAYDDGGGLVFYFASSLLADNGDANASYWFLQNKVSVQGGNFVCPGVPVGDDCHVVGDVLVQANFSNGGTTATISVFKWVGDGFGDVPPKGNLDTVVAAANAICTNAPGAPTVACAIVNSATIGTIDAPDTWGYESKFPVDYTGSSPASEPNTDLDDYPPTTFFEGGLDVADLFPEGLCFATFIAGTRSSTSVRSIREDFARGDFETCGLDMSAGCALDGDGFNDDYTAFAYLFSGTVFTTIGTLYDVEIVDLGDDLVDPSDDVVVATIPQITTSPSGWGPVSFETASTSGPTKTYMARGAATDGGEKSIISESMPSANCTPPSLSPDISISKECRACLALDNGKVVVNVHAQGEVCNLGDAPLINVAVTDDRGTPSDDSDDVTFALDAGEADEGNLAIGQCKSYTLAYAPGAVVGNTPDPSLASFTDNVQVTAQTSLGFPVEPDSTSANCPLCLDGVDPPEGLSCPPLTSE